MTLRQDIIAALDTITALGERNYSDRAPDGADLPYTVTRLDISDAPALRGDGRTLAVTRLAQIDVWEARSAEDEVLRKAIWTTLDGLELSAAFKLSVRSAPRVSDPNFDLLHRAFTIAATQRIS